MGLHLSRLCARRSCAGIVLALIAMTAWSQAGLAADFNVTTPTFAFTINGVTTPTLTLVRGKTYSFNVNTTPGFHPFRINMAGAPTPSTTTTFNFTVAADAPGTNTYDCQVHGAFMAGTILVVDPPRPRITSYTFGDSIVLRSSPVTNTATVSAEYNTNLSTTNWFALTVQSNRFSNGTNEVFCGRPPGSNVFFRVKVQ